MHEKVSPLEEPINVPSSVVSWYVAHVCSRYLGGKTLRSKQRERKEKEREREGGEGNSF